jgi:hypothetical protein
LLEFSVDALVLHYQLPGDKVLGLAKFFLGIGVPGIAKDFFNQVESLALLESKRQVLYGKIYNFSSAL